MHHLPQQTVDYFHSTQTNAPFISRPLAMESHCEEVLFQADPCRDEIYGPFLTQEGSFSSQLENVTLR